MWGSTLIEEPPLVMCSKNGIDERRNEKKLNLLTLAALHHLAVCFGCTVAGSFWGRGLWVGAEHHDTSQPGPSECPYETEGRSERTPHPRWWADSCGERDKSLVWREVSKYLNKSAYNQMAAIPSHTLPKKQKKNYINTFFFKKGTGMSGALAFNH